MDNYLGATWCAALEGSAEFMILFNQTLTLAALFF